MVITMWEACLLILMMIVVLKNGNFVSKSAYDNINLDLVPLEDSVYFSSARVFFKKI